MNMKISMIALDLDGTCLDSRGEMTDRTRKILEKYGKAGTEIVFTTGRPIAGILSELRSISGTNYAIALNGGLVYQLADNSIIYRKSIDKREVMLVRDIVLRHDALTDVASGGLGIGDKKTYDRAENYIKNDDFRKYYLSSRGSKQNLWENIEELESVEKINMFFSDMDDRRKTLEELQILKTSKVCSGMPNNIEINHCEVNKGNALKWLCEKLDIDISELIAFGDGGNDIDMIKTAGCGVAMANACEELKEISDIVTKSNDEDGVAYILEKYSLT